MWATLINKGTWMTFDAQGLLSTSERYESKITIQHQASSNRELDYKINVYFTKRARDYYPNPNETVNDASGGLIPKTADEFNFYGPVFAFYGRRGSFLDVPEYCHEIVQAHDMDMRSYADLMAYLTYYCNRERFASLKGPKVPCVKVASVGDFQHGAHPYQVVNVPRTHPIFVEKGVSSPISERLEMPMLTWKYPATPWDPQNQPITFMHLSLDPTARNMQKNIALFEFAPLLFQSKVGTQLVASTAKTPPSVRTVHAFCDFCQHHLAEYFEEYSDVGGDAAARPGSVKPSERVLDQITFAKYTEFLSNWIS